MGKSGNDVLVNGQKWRNVFRELSKVSNHKETGSHIVWLGVKQEIVLPLDYIICHF